jgi:hypothetical protein
VGLRLVAFALELKGLKQEHMAGTISYRAVLNALRYDSELTIPQLYVWLIPDLNPDIPVNT